MNLLKHDLFSIMHLMAVAGVYLIVFTFCSLTSNSEQFHRNCTQQNATQNLQFNPLETRTAANGFA